MAYSLCIISVRGFNGRQASFMTECRPHKQSMAEFLESEVFPQLGKDDPLFSFHLKGAGGRPIFHMEMAPVPSILYHLMLPIHVTGEQMWPIIVTESGHHVYFPEKRFLALETPARWGVIPCAAKNDSKMTKSSRHTV